MKILILQKDLDNKDVEVVRQAVASIKTLLPIEFIYQFTDYAFTSRPFVNETNSNGYMINPQEIFDLGKKSNCDAYVLIYSWNKVNPKPTNPFCSGMNIQIPKEWYNGYTNVLVEFFLHELCHYFFQKTGKQDITHLLVNRNLNPELYDKFSKKTPTDFYIYLIKDFLLPTVIIERQNYNEKQTTGILKYGDFSCKTLERAWDNNKRNISCIPKGTYQVKMTFSPKFMRYTYEILNVPNRSGIRIHSANYWFQLNGCVSLGDNFKDLNKDGKLDVTNSKATIKKFEDLLHKYPFTLIIN